MVCAYYSFMYVRCLWTVYCLCLYVVSIPMYTCCLYTYVHMLSLYLRTIGMYVGVLSIYDILSNYACMLPMVKQSLFGRFALKLVSLLFGRVTQKSLFRRSTLFPSAPRLNKVGRRKLSLSLRAIGRGARLSSYIIHGRHFQIYQRQLLATRCFLRSHVGCIYV